MDWIGEILISFLGPKENFEGQISSGSRLWDLKNIPAEKDWKWDLQTGEYRWNKKCYQKCKSVEDLFEETKGVVRTHQLIFLACEISGNFEDPFQNLLDGNWGG